MSPKVLCRLLALLLLPVGYGSAQTTAPDTPAGHTLQAWLDAFNSGDRARVETYVKTVDKSQSVDGMISFTVRQVASSCFQSRAALRCMFVSR